MKSFGVVILFGLLAGSLCGAEWPKRPAVVQDLVREAFANNVALQGEQIQVEQALARLEQARSFYQPRIDFSARYSRADGGRTIDIPVGDVVNPVYRTLNQLLAAQGQPAPFSDIPNQAIPLLRSHEQETKIRLVQPLYRPEISRGVAARRANWESREAQFAAFRRELRFSVESAWYRYRQARAAVAILTSATELTAEAVRANRLLFQNEKVTEDRVLRAEADQLTIRQQLAEAERDRNSARAYLNFLLNRPLTTEVGGATADDQTLAIESAITPPTDSSLSFAGREELNALEKGIRAAASNEEAEKSRQRPTVGLAVEGGIQGEDYHTGPGANFVMGSVLAEMNLWDGGERRSATRAARLERRRLELQLAAVKQQISLEVQRARDDLQAAIASLNAATLRREASAKAFELVSRREREGLATQLGFLDSRNELTSAELNLAITQNRVLIAAAALDRAAALSPLP